MAGLLGDDSRWNIATLGGAVAIAALGYAYYYSRCVEISPEGLTVTLERADMTGEYPLELYYQGPDGKKLLEWTIPDTATLYSGRFDYLSPEYCVQRGRKR